MTYADEIRRQAEASPRAALPAVTAMLWRAYSDGHISEAEAEALSGLIGARSQRGTHQARTLAVPETGIPASAQDRQNCPRRPGVGSRPRTDASMERRRRWAASGRLPPGLAARFTLAEQAVLALVAAEHARRKDCRLAVGHLAAIAGVSETTVRNAIREARKLGLLTVEERPVTGFRNLPNIVRVVSPEWLAWLRLARSTKRTDFVRLSDHPPVREGGGCKSPNRTPTQVLESGTTRPAAPSQRLPGGSGRPRPERPSGIVGSGRVGGAMR